MFFRGSGRDKQDTQLEHTLNVIRQILFSYLSKYFIETAYVWPRNPQLQLHNFLYWENSNTFCSFYSAFNLKWLYSTNMPSRRLYSRPLRKFLVFMENDITVVKFLVSLVLLALTAPVDNTTTTWKHIFGSKTLIFYYICYGEWRKFKDYLFSIFFFLTKWNPLCWRLLTLYDCLTFFFCKLV